MDYVFVFFKILFSIYWSQKRFKTSDFSAINLLMEKNEYRTIEQGFKI